MSAKPLVRRDPKSNRITIVSGGQAIFGLTDEAAVEIARALFTLVPVPMVTETFTQTIITK